MTESSLQRAILLATRSTPGLRLWRQSVGLAVPMSVAARLRELALLAVEAGLAPRSAMPHVQPLRYGQPGMADLSGLLGPSGRRVELEVKAPRGRLSEQQERWGEMVRSRGGLWIVARSVEEAQEGLQA